jgi:hypothetical protein
MRLGKTVVTLKPERALGEPGDEVDSGTTRRSVCPPTRRYGEARPPGRAETRQVTNGDVLPASLLFEQTDDDPDTEVVDPPDAVIPRPRERVLTPAPALFEDSGLFQL